jgi:hydroxyacylglutathione hydrolase
MDMLEFEKVLPNTYLLRTPFGAIWSGVYLLTGAETILIDTGASAETVDQYLVPALAKLSMTIGEIDWIINTHSHGDHVGGNRRVLELSGHAKMAAFAGAVDKIENPLPYGVAIRTCFPQHSPAPQTVLEGCPVSLSLKDGEVLANRLQVLHTSGHDTECICLLDLTTGGLFTGDSLQGFGTVGDGGAGLAFYQDLPGYKNSLDRLEALCPEHLLSAHDYAPYGCFAHGKEEVRRYLRACRMTTEIYDTLVRRMLANGMTDVAEITQQVILQVGAERPEKLFLAMHSIQCHILEISGEQLCPNR